MATNNFDVIEAAARMEFDGSDDVVNVYQYQLLSGGTISDATTVTQIVAILELLYGIIIGVQSSLLVYRDIRLTNKTQSILLGTVGWPTLVAGGGLADSIPPGVASLANFNTQVSRVSPRKYFGGLEIATLDQDGTFTAVFGVVMTGILAFLLATQAQASQNWQYGFLSPKTLSFEIPVGSSWTDIPAYQRRRKQGRGS